MINSMQASSPICYAPCADTPTTPTRPENAFMRSISASQSRPHALSAVRGARSLHLEWSRGSRVQGGSRHSAKARRNALDPPRLKRDHRASVLQTQCAFRTFGNIMRIQQKQHDPTSHHFLVVHPAAMEFTSVKRNQARRPGAAHRWRSIPNSSLPLTPRYGRGAFPAFPALASKRYLRS